MWECVFIPLFRNHSTYLVLVCILIDAQLKSIMCYTKCTWLLLSHAFVIPLASHMHWCWPLSSCTLLITCHLTIPATNLTPHPSPLSPSDESESWVTKLYRTKYQKIWWRQWRRLRPPYNMEEKERKNTPGNTFSKWKCINFPYWLQMDFECHIQLVDLPESLNQTMDTKTWDYYHSTRQKHSIHRRK